MAVPPPGTTLVRRLAESFLLAALAATPLLSLVGHPGAFLADPASELPVKLFGFDRFAEADFWGGTVTELGFPTPGTLNNPDPVGTVVTAALRPLGGRVGSYNAYVFLQLWASLAATVALARDLVRDRGAALVAGVAFALAPLVLTYGVASAVTDVLALWPWPLAVRHALRALRGGPPAREGAIAGAWAVAGLWTCPYNAVVFAAAVVPGVVLLPWVARRVPWRTLVGAVVAAGLVVGVGTAGQALWMRSLVEAPTAQISATHLAETRHAPPFHFLRPAHRDRYVARLVDYVTMGDETLVVREAGSRYLRAFAPGLLLIGLALLGAADRVAARVALGVGLFFALVSTGPFGVVTDTRAFWVNPAWYAVWHVVPGTKLLLEPFRYALGVGLGLGLAAAMGAEVLVRRWGRWVGQALAVAVVVEVAFVSPVPAPLPAAPLTVPRVYWQLDTLLPPGPIVELPWFHLASERFERRHFLQQRIHGRPIADEVIGFVPRYLQENQFTALLLYLEKSTGLLTVPVTDPERAAADLVRLREDGFVGIVVDPAAYRQRAWHEVRAILDASCERVYVGERFVYRLRDAR